MIETLSKAAEMTAMKSIESFGKSFEFKLPDFSQKKQEVTDAVLDARAEAAAHSASKFFNLPEAKIQKGNTIGVYKNGEGTFLDDVFEYNLEQFKKMNCTSFEDMTKVWAHECGHRLLQNIFPNSWADELGADFFAGARSEMLGLPKSNFEKMLGSTNASKSHPDGALRMKAMDYGRFVVTQMRKAGIQPTWENCISAFLKSQFSELTYENIGDNKASLINDRTWHLNEANKAKNNQEYYLKKSKEAAKRGDIKTSAEYASKADSYRRKAENEISLADSCTKFIEYDPKDHSPNGDRKPEISFSGKYSKEEIDRMKREVENKEYELSCRKNDVSNWESKVSLLKNHKDYGNALAKLDQAKSRYNRVKEELDKAKSRLNNAL